MEPHVAKNRASWNDESDEYQALHTSQLDEKELAWGVWSLSEDELRVLGDVRGRDVLEYGCGAAQWSIFLARRGARPVGLDASERQLFHARERVARAGVRVPLVHADAERAPFADASFDVVFCDHGAMTFADPRRTVPEVARLLRPGGLFAFNMSSPLRDLFYDEVRDEQTDGVVHNYFEMRRIEEAGSVSFQLPYGEWLRLFRASGFTVEDLIELRPPRGAASTYEGFDVLERARRWPVENIWKLRRARVTAAPPPAGYPRISPYLNYEDTGAMMAWLARAFGLVERHSMRDGDGQVVHAEMALEESVVMMGTPAGSFRNPKRLGQVTQSLYVYVDDVDAHCERAREAGAELLEEPADQPYGDRRYGARDPEGHHWYFATRLAASGG